jgi:UPF0716 protein FxsA
MRKRWLVLLLLLLPLVDAILLVYVAVAYLGAVATVALVVLTGFVGMLLVRAEGRRTIAKMQRSLARGEPPTDELLDGGLLIAAGAFLLAPGIITDVLGFAFAIPITRIPVRMALKKWVVVPYADEKTGGFASGNVYVGGFPGDDDFQGGAWGTGDDSGPGPGFGGSGGPDAGDVHDLDEDDYDVTDPYDVDVEDVRDDEG